MITTLAIIAIYVGSILSLGLHYQKVKARITVSDVEKLKGAYAEAIKRQDTRDQHEAWKPLFDARTAQLRREVGR